MIHYLDDNVNLEPSQCTQIGQIQEDHLDHADADDQGNNYVKTNQEWRNISEAKHTVPHPARYPGPSPVDACLIAYTR